MHRIRKLVGVGLVALALSAVAASTAPAVEVRDATTGTALAVGDSINGVTSSTSTLTWSFFGIPQPITCSQVALVAGLTANAPAPTGTLTTLSWTSCRTSDGTACTVTTLGTPWTAALSFPSATQMSWAIPSNGGWRISGTGCLPSGSTCTFGASQTLNFTWANVAGGPGTASYNQTVTSPICGAATWTITYNYRKGSTVGSGNGLQVV